MFERHWKYYPALKIGIPFAMGCVVAYALAPPTGQCLILLLAALGWFLISIGRCDVSLSLLVVICFTGMLAFTTHSQSCVDRLEGDVIREGELIGRVVSDPVIKQTRVEVLVACDSLLYRNSVAHPRILVLLRLTDSTTFNPAMLPRCGDHISVAGVCAVPGGPVNPGELDLRAILRSRGIGMTMAVSRASSIYVVNRDDLTLIDRILLPVRREVRGFADRFVQGEEGDIVRALVLGERDYIDTETNKAYMKTGTIHLLSVSGLHVGVMAMVIFVAVSWLRSRWLQLTVFTTVLGAYVLLAGAGPSILRAAIMAVAFMLARVTGRIARPLNTLAFAFLVIILLDPDQLFDIGFQLSFASVAGITVLYGPIGRAVLKRVRWIKRHSAPRALMQLLLLSLCAQLVTLPLVLYHFGYVSFIGLVINIPVVPLYSAALGAAIAGALLAPVCPPLAGYFGGAAFLALRIAGGMVQWAAGLSLAGAQMGSIGMIGAVAIAIALICLLFSRTPWQFTLRFAMVAVVVAGAFTIRNLFDPLSGSGGAHLFLLKGREGTIAAVIRNDTVLMIARHPRDSIAVMRLAEALGMRVGARTVQARWMEGDGAIEAVARSELAMRVVNDRPCEVVLDDLPVVLSNTSMRPLALVEAFGQRFLQVPMRSEIDEAVVFRFNHGWEVVDWH